ncbi:MAG TPA: NAD(+)/NADH kinase, partial [Moraxellaceae bacterium]|nr:NAD(+)/NADH kinase [Moraxellaceae bacterium]
MKPLSDPQADAASKSLFRLGFIVNPLAGLGGTVALKGSDGVAELALARGAIPKAGERARAALEALLPWREQVRVLAADGAMGADLARELGYAVEVVHTPGMRTTGVDTTATAKALRDRHVDLLLFAGGDGTAR